MNTANWSKLPRDLLKRIADEITTIRDYFFLGVVCKSWHSYLPKTIYKPRPALFYKNSSNKLKFLDPKKQAMLFSDNASNHQTCIWGSFCGWIFTNNHLINPLTNATLLLPKIDQSQIRKALVFKNPVSWHTHGYGNASDIIGMLIYGSAKGVYLCKLPGDRKWKDVNGANADLMDIVCCGDRVFGVCGNGALLVFRAIQSKKNVIIRASIFSQPYYVLYREPNNYGNDVDSIDAVRNDIKGVYLAELEGELLMILEINRDTPFVRFIVMKFNFETRSWKRTDSLGNRALFIGTNYSISVPVLEDDDHNFIKGNCIYFTKHVCFISDYHKLKETSGDIKSSYVWVFDVKSGGITEYIGKGKAVECYGYCWLMPSFS